MGGGRVGWGEEGGVGKRKEREAGRGRKVNWGGSGSRKGVRREGRRREKEEGREGERGWKEEEEGGRGEERKEGREEKEERRRRRIEGGR